jgi:hypothetical protein
MLLPPVDAAIHSGQVKIQILQILLAVVIVNFVKLIY